MFSSSFCGHSRDLWVPLVSWLRQQQQQPDHFCTAVVPSGLSCTGRPRQQDEQGVGCDPAILLVVVVLSGWFRLTVKCSCCCCSCRLLFQDYLDSSEGLAEGARWCSLWLHLWYLMVSSHTDNLGVALSWSLSTVDRQTNLEALMRN